MVNVWCLLLRYMFLRGKITIDERNFVMSNQRRGNTHRASLDDGMGVMKTRNFFRACAQALEDEPDAQFYFQQIVDHINDGGSIMTDDPSSIRRILGL